MLRLGAACGALALASAAVAQDRTVLPVPPAPFSGTIAENVLDSTPSQPRPVRAPAGAPNVLVFMSDDVGYSMASTFGGPVPTPNFDRLAAMGERYNRFHTTGICSPTRAALLTGRNHHNAGNGYLSDLPAGFPGYAGKISPQTATIAQVLRLNGYNTAMFGKHHNTPGAERTEAGPFNSWPTGIGFEYYFGFNNGDSDQYQPVLYRGTVRVDADEGQGRMLDRRLADDIVRWVHNQKAAAPDKPFFVYWAPGSTHAPHQAPPEVIARFRGKFDQGWDRMREQTWRRQLALGIVPRGTRLTPRPDAIPAWDSLAPEQKAFAARTMEVAAAQLAYQDEQFGRVLDELQRMGSLDDTLVSVIIGDNGASGEAGPTGTINELRSISTHDERPAWLVAQTDRLGGPMTYENYPVGWAWAMDTPLRWVKQVASMLGGVRNGMILSWKGHVPHPGSICPTFGHVIDIAPTVLDAAHLPAPAVVNGIRQKPMDGQSLLPSLAACDPDKPRTQYFEIGGKVGLYHDGWFLSGDDGRLSWEPLPPGGPRPPMSWTLYDLRKDFSQGINVSAKYPQQLAGMKALWEQEARRNDVFPLDHRFGPARSDLAAMAGGRKHFDYWGKEISLPAMSGPYLAARSFTVKADLRLDSASASGAVLAWGSRFGGWSLFLDQGRPAFVWARSTDPQEMARVVAPRALPAGSVQLTLRFVSHGLGQPAEAILSSGGTELARGILPGNVLMPAGGGETLDIGRDLGVPVTDYRTPHGELQGDVPRLTVDFD
ncbi:MAG: arylsulfatase [Novosphingobium sp.]|nr:arylsulfatase [Novosphingobium sp.]